MTHDHEAYRQTVSAPLKGVAQAERDQAPEQEHRQMASDAQHESAWQASPVPLQLDKPTTPSQPGAFVAPPLVMSTTTAGAEGYAARALRLVRLVARASFHLVYTIIHALYHLLIPKPVRMVFWYRRWERAQRKEMAALTVLNTDTTTSDRKRDRKRDSAIQSHQYTKTGLHFFIFAGVPYYDIGGGQRSAQLAKTLNKMGYAVHYIYAVEASDSGKRLGDLPVTKHVALARYAPKQLIADLMGAPVFVFEIPTPQFEPYLNLARTLGARVIYEHIDNWESSLGGDLFTEAAYHRFLDQADVIVATARPLEDKVLQSMASRPELASQSAKVTYLPNAVDTDLFTPLFQYEPPTDLVVGDITLLYYGSLWGAWFDWSLIEQVAKACPTVQINLIGDHKPIQHLTGTMPRNVHFLGPKLQLQLPSYLAHTDVALLPFKNDEIGKYVSPLKIFEYIAMNTRVLATALPDIIGYPNVFASDNGDEWVAYVQGLLNNKNEPVADEVANPSTEALEFASENNWYARCNRLLDILEETSASGNELSVINARPSVSAIILNHNNRTVIGRCITTLLHYSRRYDLELIVVDNASTDGSDVFIEQTYGESVVFLRNSKNGCSSGRNLGAQHARGAYLLFIDSDQWVVSDRWLDTPLHILQRYRNIGAVGWAAGWFSKGSLGGPITAYLPQGGVPARSCLRTDVAYLGSGGLLMRRDVWNATEGFDEAYDPTVFEDTDLTLQIKDMGFDLAYTPHMNLSHLPHQTTQSGSATHSTLMERNGAYFRQKWNKRNPSLLAPIRPIK